MTATDASPSVPNAGSRAPGVALAVIATAQLMVVLDSTIVNVALPYMQRSLHFSGDGLEWIVNAYTLAFGGLLLLGGRIGDLLGRRKVFLFGLALFTIASLAGGFATAQWFLLTARALQGVGAAIVAPTSLALVSTTFPAGKARNEALGIVAAMGGIGATIGLLAGGLLTSYISWRWVLFVNVPIGILTAIAAPSVIPESPRQRGSFDLLGAITGTGGVTLLVYGLISATAGQDGISHWGDGKVVFSLVAAAVLLVAFGVIEARSRNALVPIRVVANMSRAGAYVIALCLGTAVSSVFFFLTIFIQNAWSYGAMRTGLAYLPMSVSLVLAAIAAESMITKIGARAVLIIGSLITAVGMFWVAAVGVHPGYLSDMLGPTFLTGVGLGMIFSPMTIVGMSLIREEEAGAASGLVNAGRQVGGSIGLAVLGTIAWTQVAHYQHSHLTSGNVRSATSVTNHALASGFSRAFVGAGIVMLICVAIAAFAIRIRTDELEIPGHDTHAPESESEAVQTAG